MQNVSSLVLINIKRLLNENEFVIICTRNKYFSFERCGVDFLIKAAGGIKHDATLLNFFFLLFFLLSNFEAFNYVQKVKRKW